jgi:hypothetical protein
MSENEVDISVFMEMCRELQAMAPDKTMGEVVTASLGQLLKNCVAHTPARSPGEIAKIGRGNYVKFDDGTIISRWRSGPVMYLDPSTWEARSARGKHATAPPKFKKGGMTWHEMNSPDRRWSGARWASFHMKNAQRMRIAAQKQRAAELAIGLAKQSFWNIALKLGLDPSIAPAYVRNAKSPDGKDYSSESSVLKETSGAEFSIVCEITNALLCGKLDGHSIVANGLEARQKAFATDMEKGVFDGIKQRAKRYPGIFTD